MQLPLEDVKVLDLTHALAGPFCSTMLADFGAQIIKLEPPEGDWSRGLTTSKDTVSVLSVCFNRGKRSIVLDLKTPEGGSSLMTSAPQAASSVAQ